MSAKKAKRTIKKKNMSAKNSYAKNKYGSHATCHMPHRQHRQCSTMQATQRGSCLQQHGATLLSLSIFMAALSLLAKMTGNCRVKCDRSSWKRETRHSEYDRSIDHAIYSFLEVARECKCINLLTDRSIHWSTIICPNWSTGSVHYADTDRSWVINSHSLEAFKKN